jgi:excisionase family DNA binding protein
MEDDKKMAISSWDELPAILTAQECADFLRVHLNTVKKHLAEGTLPGKKVGRQWRVNKKDLQEFMGL